MTVCKMLKQAILNNGEMLQAWEMQDKYSAAKRYEVSVSNNGLAYTVYPCARTTWNRVFRELARA